MQTTAMHRECMPNRYHTNRPGIYDCKGPLCTLLRSHACNSTHLHLPTITRAQAPLCGTKPWVCTERANYTGILERARHKIRVFLCESCICFVYGQRVRVVFVFRVCFARTPTVSLIGADNTPSHFYTVCTYAVGLLGTVCVGHLQTGPQSPKRSTVPWTAQHCPSCVRALSAITVCRNSHTNMHNEA